MKISPHDREVLRRLAERKAAIAALPVQKERTEMWTRLNKLEKVRPLVWLTEVPWHEVNVNDELTLQTSGKFLRSIEEGLRRELYQWEHMQGDMVVEPVMDCPLAIESSGFGIKQVGDTISQGAGSAIKSQHFDIQIKEEKDIAKINDPVITHDEKLTAEWFQAMTAIFDGILPVNKAGKLNLWFAPWDELVRWTGVEEVLMDMALRPEYVHSLINRLVTAHLKMLDQYEALGLLSLNNRNTRVGSGAYCYTDELPWSGFDSGQIKAADTWGCATAQIFSEVSPEMHLEFALQYEVRWLERFGLNYYGCCEPLHNKLEILKKAPRLRKVSCSPWMDMRKAVREAGGKYVFSLKTNPAFLAEDKWRPELCRRELETKLEIARGCPVEIIMKDISTVRSEPKRLWEWAKIAVETAEKIA